MKIPAFTFLTVGVVIALISFFIGLRDDVSHSKFTFFYIFAVVFVIIGITKFLKSETKETKRIQKTTRRVHHPSHQATKKQCPNCGMVLSANVKICGCGYRFY